MVGGKGGEADVAREEEPFGATCEFGVGGNAEVDVGGIARMGEGEAFGGEEGGGVLGVGGF
jgi:hypothetical protein